MAPQAPVTWWSPGDTSPPLFFSQPELGGFPRSSCWSLRMASADRCWCRQGHQPEPVRPRSAGRFICWLRTLRSGGWFHVVGFASGEIPRLPSNIVLLRNRNVIGVDWGDWVRAERGTTAGRDLLTDVLGRIRAGTINPPLPEPVPLTGAEQLLRRFAERRASGKYVVRPHQD